MKVGIFYNSVSNPSRFPHKKALMDNFKLGVLANGDIPVDFYENELPTTDLNAGFLLGYTLADNLRKSIINTLTENNSIRIYADSNILNYSNPDHEWHRYSVNSVYPSTGIYFFDALDYTKWETFSRYHDVELKPWRTDGNHILILTQRSKGWNMFGNDQFRWLTRTVSKIRNVSNRPIRVRNHPNDGGRFDFNAKIKSRYQHLISISDNKDIRSDLRDCWCAIGYNSTPNVVATIEGVPGYIEDPTNSWASTAFTDLANIKDPPLPDRTLLTHRIANIHWSNDEVRSGKLWSAIKQRIFSTNQ